MSVDENMVRRIANLARIGVTDGELPALAKEL
ncbi:MAG: Asp-tRNA(Asn)/Glu-tRNA(Gln) amidotransferase GatCAB subunit C, partial [Alphaproteobacteria bacterium]|nr:Asp-tRNA(Asn)/Glu-tRNA(Gln) amidotransferase GatCAB subunit C [Alphaproteobacteria bacterium]